MHIADLCRESQSIAVAHGWRESPRTFGDEIALMHSELSEALEEFRAGHPVDQVRHEQAADRTFKPEGVPAELADVVIRVCEAAAHYGIDLEEAINVKLAYNRTRSYRHGGKRL